jgi:predicted small lipoprotein YifL
LEALQGAENKEENFMKFTWMMMLLLAAPLAACGNSKPAEVPEGGEATEEVTDGPGEATEAVEEATEEAGEAADDAGGEATDEGEAVPE